MEMEFVNMEYVFVFQVLKYNLLNKGVDCSLKEECKNNCSNAGICIEAKCICKEKDVNDDCSVKDEYIPPIIKNHTIYNNMKFKEIEEVVFDNEDIDIHKNTHVKKFLYSAILLFSIVFLILIILFLNRKNLLN